MMNHRKGKFMKHGNLLLRGLTTAAMVGAFASSAMARDYISIVGSSTVYPFATVVAEQYGKTTRYKTPKIESTGSGGGIKLFCAGVGVEHPDITNSSRRIKKSEVEACAKNGVKDIVEVKIGYDGIAIANSKAAPAMGLSIKEVFLALAKEIPQGGKIVANPNRTWRDVNSALPAIKIEVLGPPPTSGTRDAFVELVMDVGCDAIPEIQALAKSDAKRHKQVCQTLREDGAFIEAGENDNLIVQKLVANKDALGIFGFSFLDQNADKLQGTAINGVKPEFDSIASGKYPVSRPLYFYVKKAHIGNIPGMKEYLAEFTSEKAWGNSGYLSEKGLIPLPKQERAQVANEVKQLHVLMMSAL